MGLGRVIRPKSKARSLGLLVVLVFISLYSHYYRYHTRYPKASTLISGKTWVHRSWMEYPHPLSFPGSPSLLNEANPKPLNVLFVNYHGGVEMEVHAVLAKVVASINQSVHFTHTRGVGDLTDFIVTEAASMAYYPLHTDHRNSSIYDLIVVGDVVTYSRPYLQFACKTNIILYITNQFDFLINNDSEYSALVSTASRWPNVRVIVNNLHEHNYALTARNACRYPRLCLRTLHRAPF